MFKRRNKAGQGPPNPPLLQPLNPGEVEWRDGQIEVAGLFAERYTGESEESLPSLSRLDATVAAWLSDDESRIDINSFVNAMGMAFGAHVAADARLAWVIATDEQGSDLALHGEPGDILLYPANAVAKRIAAGESDFVVALHTSFVRSVDRVRAEAQGT